MRLLAFILPFAFSATASASIIGLVTSFEGGNEIQVRVFSKDKQIIMSVYQPKPLYNGRCKVQPYRRTMNDWNREPLIEPGENGEPLVTMALWYNRECIDAYYEAPEKYKDLPSKPQTDEINLTRLFETNARLAEHYQMFLDGRINLAVCMQHYGGRESELACDPFSAKEVLGQGKVVYQTGLRKYLIHLPQPIDGERPYLKRAPPAKDMFTLPVIEHRQRMANLKPSAFLELTEDFVFTPAQTPPRSNERRSFSFVNGKELTAEENEHYQSGAKLGSLFCGISISHPKSDRVVLPKGTYRIYFLSGSLSSGANTGLYLNGAIVGPEAEHGSNPFFGCSRRTIGGQPNFTVQEFEAAFGGRIRVHLTEY
ncbi:MAG TPA: hypothetical protein VFV50_18635 [Bdellovibrionales bacterium]|nr:hypothetical protein [Bdellovibrionales bacterium]